MEATVEEKYETYLKEKEQRCKCGAPMNDFGTRFEYSCPKCSRILRKFPSGERYWYQLEGIENDAS